MATPHTQFPNADLDAVTLADFGKREYKLYLALVRRTYGYHRPTVPMPPAEWQRATGLAPGNIRETLKAMLKRNIFFRDPQGAYGINEPAAWQAKSALIQGGQPTQNKAVERLESRRSTTQNKAESALNQGGKAPCFKAVDEAETVADSGAAAAERKKENSKETACISSSSSTAAGEGRGVEDSSIRPRVVVPFGPPGLPCPDFAPQPPGLDRPWTPEETWDFLTDTIFRSEREVCRNPELPCGRLQFVLPEEWTNASRLERLELLVGRVGPQDYPDQALAWRERKLLGRRDCPASVWEAHVARRLSAHGDIRAGDVLREFRRLSEGRPPLDVLEALDRARQTLLRRQTDKTRPIPDPTAWLLTTWGNELTGGRLRALESR